MNNITNSLYLLKMIALEMKKISEVSIDEVLVRFYSGDDFICERRLSDALLQVAEGEFFNIDGEMVVPNKIETVVMSSDYYYVKLD